VSGIFGVADPERAIDIRSLALNMSKAMSYRDWFIAESFVDDSKNLAIGRIGIGIFNKDPQPVWNSSRTIALVMAGEIYNQEMLAVNMDAKSDEELVMALYEQERENFISKLKGVFIIAVYDQESNRILIFNDRFGLYPLFYSCRGGRLIFAPEMKGILCDGYFPQKLDLTALAQYVRFQQILGDRTFFEEIQLLPSASILIYDLASGSCSVNSYWSFADIPYNPEVSFEEAVEETAMIMSRAVNRMSADVYRPGVYLSGGLDSRTILGMIDRRPIVSLTYGVDDCRDVFYAGRIAKVVGSDHYWFDLSNGDWVKENLDFHLDLTEGFHSWIHAHGISTLPKARQLMDVNLTGWDGGTVMGHKEQIEPLQVSSVDDAAFITRLFYLFNQKYTWPSITEAEENLLYCQPIHSKLQGLAFESFRDEISNYLDYRSDLRGEYFYLNNHSRRLTHNLVTFTRSHIEVRFPFFDYDLIEFLYSISAEVRGHQKLYRSVIQRQTPQLAYIPYDHDEFLPTTHTVIRDTHALSVKLKRRINRHLWSIFPQLKTLYADYENYLRTDLREWAESILFDQRTVERGIFDPKYLRSLMDRHLSKQEEWTIGKIAPIITYEMMLRRYYD
jgi:asparagine synthase (glutamine-hydrolysing)